VRAGFRIARGRRPAVALFSRAMQHPGALGILLRQAKI
jgi:hypothetical protein